VSYFSSNRCGFSQIGSDLVPMLFSKRVDLIIQGHEHGFERSKQLICATPNTFNSSCVVDAGNNFTKGNGTVIAVLGTGGQTLRTVNPVDAEAAYFRSADITTYGYGLFKVTAERIEFNYTCSSGGTFSNSFVLVNRYFGVSSTSYRTLSSTVPSLKPTTFAPSSAQVRNFSMVSLLDILFILSVRLLFFLLHVFCRQCCL
jgi:hypothetical protein